VQGAYHRPRILEDEVTNFGRPRPHCRSRILDGWSADAVADFARNGSGFWKGSRSRILGGTGIERWAIVRHRECLWHDGRAAGFNSELGAVVAPCRESRWLRRGEAARGDVHGPRDDSYLCCNNNVDAGTVSESGWGVYSGSVKKLDLNRHGRNASDSVGTVTGNSAWSTLTAHKPPAHPQE